MKTKSENPLYRKLINELDAQHPSVAGCEVRHVCEWILGEAIGDRRWRRWRRTVDVGLWAQNFTWGEAVAMGAMAYLKQLDPNRKVSQDDLIKQIRSPQVSGFINEAYDFCIQNGCYGRDLPGLLQKFGKPMSLRSLRRKVPGFSCKKRYFKRQIDEILSA